MGYMNRVSYLSGVITFAVLGLAACGQPQGPLRLEPGLYENTQIIVSTGQSQKFDFSLIDAAAEEDRGNMRPRVNLVAVEPTETHKVWRRCMTGHELMEVALNVLVSATHGECELVTHNVRESEITLQNTCPSSKYRSSKSQRWNISVGETRQSLEIITKSLVEYRNGETYHTDLIHTASYLGPCEAIDTPPTP